jgi:hypothetical protein
MVAVGTTVDGLGQGRSFSFQMPRIPAPSAPPASSSSRSPIITPAAGSTPSRSATARKTAGCGLEWGRSEVVMVIVPSLTFFLIASGRIARGLAAGAVKG